MANFKVTTYYTGKPVLVEVVSTWAEASALTAKHFARGANVSEFGSCK